MKVLVTGGAGRLGRFVVAELGSAHEVAVFDTVAPADRSVPFIAGDIRDRDAVAAALRGMEAVVHLAGIPVYTGENAPFMDVNIGGTFNVLEGMVRQEVRKIVFASSICTYGFIFWKTRWTPDYFPIDERHPTRPDDMYGVSKLVGDELCYAHSRRYGISAVCLRLATVWFPDDPSYTQKFIDRLPRPELHVNGIWNHVDARDVARAFSLGLTKDVAFDTFNVGARSVASLTETLELIRQFYPDVPTIKNHESFLVERDRALFDATKARRELGWEPKYSWRDYVTAPAGS
jgi:nucleoside-diphosphate-sugar epimerase